MIEMTEELASRTYDILVEHAEAIEREHVRGAFVSHQVKDGGCMEYRFQGSLGFGGKLWVTLGYIPFNPVRVVNRMYVSCYPEDQTPERLKTIEKVNGLLMELLVSMAYAGVVVLEDGIHAESLVAGDSVTNTEGKGWSEDLVGKKVGVCGRENGEPTGIFWPYKVRAVELGGDRLVLEPWKD